jgi:hypothetical protein
MVCCLVGALLMGHFGIAWRIVGRPEMRASRIAALAAGLIGLALVLVGLQAHLSAARAGGAGTLIGLAWLPCAGGQP